MKEQNACDDASRDVLMYNSSCPVCSGTAKWIRDNAIEGSFDMVPCQAVQNRLPYPGIKHKGIKHKDFQQAIHLILTDGTILAGEQALSELVTRLRKYRLAGVLFKVPGATAVSRLVYRWFAVRRYRIEALPSHLPHFSGSAL